MSNDISSVKEAIEAVAAQIPYGDYLVVKKDGDIVCYHFIKLNLQIRFTK